MDIKIQFKPIKSVCEKWRKKKPQQLCSRLQSKYTKEKKSNIFYAILRANNCQIEAINQIKTEHYEQHQHQQKHHSHCTIGVWVGAVKSCYIVCYAINSHFIHFYFDFLHSFQFYLLRFLFRFGCFTAALCISGISTNRFGVFNFIHLIEKRPKTSES